ncbi:tetratricopeptide repeat-containing sensor histidine kinase [Aquimarina sediminis]|uniref:tetratricopeptide repeat-containing sensor histidine kinase n=1 Tax=Aquimarina sediminis TaxID=2070536 RepID=UPI000CA004A7|nr:tetratricopeptide repeat protein [Aquimarina sediminis]
MFQKSLFLLCLLFVTSIAFSQKNKLDSLSNLLRTQQNRDTIRINTLLEISYYYMDREVEKSLSYLEEALEISKVLKDKKKEGTVYNYLSRFYRKRGLSAEALESSIIAKGIIDSFGTKQQKIAVNSELLYTYGSTGSIKKSLELGLENLDLVKNDPPSSNKARMYYNLGNVYSELEELDKAETAYQTAIEMCREIKFIRGEMLMMNSLGALYKKQHRFKEATLYFNKIVDYYKSINNGGIAVASPLYHLATIQSLQGKHAESIPIYLEALELYEKAGQLAFVKFINQHLFIGYSILGDQKKATAANKVYVKIKDSIDSIERKKLIADMKIKYETDKISAERETAEVKASLAEATSKKNMNFLVAAVIIAALILLSSLFFFGRLNARKKAELITIELRETQKRLALEKQYRDSELKALKAQMNPHFIFNALNSIQEYIVLNKKNEASDYLGKFADLIRTYLCHSDTGIISLQEEIDSLIMYLDLESLRFEDTLHYTVKVSEKLNKDLIYIPTMLIQPYIENALKHGLLHKKENRKLMISFLTSEEKNIQCVIEDNGVGRAKAKEFREKRNILHKSFAAKATEERLDLLNYGKDKKIGVEIIDIFSQEKEPTGTKVVLSIPITKH